MLLGCLLLACGSDNETSAQLPGFPFDFEPPLAVDRNPASDVLEVDLVAREVEVSFEAGKKTRVYAYVDGASDTPSNAAPTLRLRVGDSLIVHFENQLPEPTTIHWHGVRVPAEMDGMPGHSQPAVQPGESFDYEFVVPDAGMFWYHPHENDAAQLGFGLYGALIVDPSEPEPEDLGDEVVMVLSDLSLTKEGELGPPDQGGSLATLFGREGNVLLVNGKPSPTLRSRNGRRQRWRLVNSAKSRYYLLALEGHTLTRIGGQRGALPAQELDQLLLTPGERADVVVTPRGAAGETLKLLWVPYDRGYGSTEFREPETVLTLALEGTQATEAPLQAPQPLAFEAIDVAGASEVNIALTMMTDEAGIPSFGISGVPWWEAEPMPAEVGEVQRWYVKNETDWDHPLHLHGFFFHELNADGTAKDNEWRDTLNVRVSISTSSSSIMQAE